MSRDPSVFQTAYTDRLASKVTDILVSHFMDSNIEERVCYEVTSQNHHNQIPQLPQSMLHEWAGMCGETLRKMALNYFKEIGTYPE